MPTVTLLVTAFGAFPGMPSNPSARLVAQLALRHRARLARLGIELVTRDLPVVYARMAGDVSHLLATIKPDAIIHVGVAGRRRMLSVETRALNRIGILRTDASRELSRSSGVVAGGRDQRACRWPATRIVAAMNETRHVAALSIDAGDYVCNQTLYLSLAYSSVPAGFLHIPRPRSRRRMLSSEMESRPSLDQMVAALAKAAIIMATEVRRSG